MGARESQSGREKNQQRKVGEKVESPWGQRLAAPGSK